MKLPRQLGFAYVAVEHRWGRIGRGNHGLSSLYKLADKSTRASPIITQIALRLWHFRRNIGERSDLDRLMRTQSGHRRVIIGLRLWKAAYLLAAPQGFEPRYADPESAVLPLNEGAATANL